MSDNGSASPIKADSGSTTPTPAITFTEKEERVLKVAWSCLKSGPPDVDYAKLQKAGDFNTLKTCQNTWGGIKKKLLQMSPAVASEGGKDGGATPKPRATPNKRTKKDAAADDEDGAATGSPAKKARTPKKSAKAKAAEEAGDDDEAADAGDATPKKKTPTKKSPVKKAPTKKTAPKVKTEESADEAKADGEDGEKDDVNVEAAGVVKEADAEMMEG